MTNLVIYIDGTPERKERPQFARTATGVRTFTRGKTKNYEARLEAAGKAAWPYAPLLCPIKLTLTAVFPIAPSWPKWRRALAAIGKLWHVGRPDIDNVIKIAMDGLNEVVWKDDAQICWLVAKKFYGTTTGLWIEVEPLDDTGEGAPYADLAGASDAGASHEDPA